MNRRVVWLGVVAGVVGVAVGCGGQVQRDFDGHATEETGGTGASSGHAGAGNESATEGVVSGAGGSAGAEQRGPLCDGTDGVRLGASWGGGFVSGYYGFLNPLGRRYLLIDGHCQFWVSVDCWEGVRSGTLAADQARAIEASVYYAQLDELNGAWTTRDCMDGGTWRVFDDIYEISCYCGCSDEGVPPAVSDVGVAVVELEEELWAIGGPEDGPLRVIALDGTGFAARDDLEWQPWPLAWSLEEALYTEQRSPPPTAGVLLEDPVELEVLRNLRRDYLAAHGPIGDDDDGFLPVTQDGAFFRVLMRDVTPWDPDGA